MDLDKKIIAVGGNARSGKDTTCVIKLAPKVLFYIPLSCMLKNFITKFSADNLI